MAHPIPSSLKQRKPSLLRHGGRQRNQSSNDTSNYHLQTLFREAPIRKIPTWRKLVEAIARLKHISRSHSDESACAGWHVCRNAKNVKLYSETETLIIKQVQSEMYSKEIDCILRKKAMPKDSRIVSLTPLTRRTRGRVVNSKRWAIVFSCLVSRVIDIEVVEEMTASAFINALRRFFAPRGKVEQFRSDRGTNFVGAVRDLGIRAINVEDGPVNSFLYQNGVEWIFNPPHSSHMGGSWERMIGLIRRVLDSMLTGVLTNNLTHDVLVTFMAEVCAVVNARPLVPVGNDPEYPFILSPSTLLPQKIDLPAQPPLDYNLLDTCMYTKQWKRVQLLAETFWRRWRTEYLHTLQPKRKWTESVPNVEEDDVVLLKDKELPRNDWAMGVIQDAIPGEDGKVRKCVARVNRGGVKTSYTRPISEIVLLIPKSEQ